MAKTSSKGKSPLKDDAPSDDSTTSSSSSSSSSSSPNVTVWVLAVIGAIFLAISIWGVFKKGAAQSTGPTLAVRVLYYFLPYALFMFTVLSDLVVQQAHFSPAALSAVSAVLLNWRVSAALETGSAMGFLSGTVRRDVDICGIPGLSWMGSPYISQNLLFTGIMLAYIVTYVYIRNGSVMQWILFGFALGYLLLQAGVTYYTCGKFQLPDTPTYFSNTLGAIGGGLVIGVGIGIAVGTICAYYLPSNDGSVPSAGSNIFRSGAPVGGPTPGVGTCSPPNDQDQFVCEAYKNGKLVTQTIAE